MWLAAATTALAVVAYFQISAARKENRQTQTLLACGQYDTSQLIFDCVKTIRKALENKTLRRKAKAHRREIITVLNFLDAIAIGIEQKLYVESLARGHLEAIVKRHVSELIDSGITEAADCPRENWSRLIKLRDEWS